MTLYEIMFIVQPDREGDALEEAVFRVKEVVERENGEVVSLKKLGKRRLAYEINDQREGSYILAHVRADKEVIPVLEHFFKVNEGYLRYIVIRLEEEKQEQAGVSTPGENISGEKELVEEMPAENVQTEEAPAEIAPAENTAEKETGAAGEVQDEGQDTV